MEIGSQRRPVLWIRKDACQPLADTVGVLGPRKRVPKPVECLDDAHGGPPCPGQFARRRRPEGDRKFAQLNRFKPCIGMYDNPSWHSVA